MIECSPSFSRKSPSPPLPPRTAEMFDLINYSPSSLDRSSIEDENGNLSLTGSRNQDHSDQNISNTDVMHTEMNVADHECTGDDGDSPTHPPPIPPRPSSSNDHSYYNMSAVIAAVNPLNESQHPSSRSTPPPPLPPKPTKQSHSPPSFPPKSNTTAPLDPQTKIEVSLDELPESDRQHCLPIADVKLKFEPTDNNIMGDLESCDVAITSEESLDMWPPLVPRRTQEMFFVATQDVQNELLCREDLHRVDINLAGNVAYKVI